MVMVIKKIFKGMDALVENQLKDTISHKPCLKGITLSGTDCARRKYRIGGDVVGSVPNSTSLKIVESPETCPGHL
jgi:hypothetical protein